MNDAQLTMRDLHTPQDYEACVALQRETWGDDFREIVSPAMLMVTQKVGGLVVGAFDAAGTLAGFVFGLTGVRDGTLVHWSHMLAVRDDLQSRGIGRRLKLYQRDRVRTLGVERILWTFDPLVARNAHLNLNRLGARVIGYVEDMYGETPMGKLDSVIGTDRFVIEWDTAAPFGASQTAAAALPRAPIVTADPAGFASAAAALGLPDAAEVLVEIPHDIQELKDRFPDAASAWRATTRRAFVHYLSAGYSIAGLVHDSTASRYFYWVRRSERG